MYGFGWNEDKPAATAQGRYRVGDRVRVVKDGFELGGSYHAAKVGDLDEIVAVDMSDDNPYEGKIWYYKAHEISPAFRPGDRVKLNKHSGVRACGERGTVSAVIGDNVSVRMDDASVYGTVVAAFHADNLDWERVEDTQGKQHATSTRVPWEEVPNPKFKAGDVVRARVSDSADDVGFLTGNIFVLTGGDDKSVYFLDNDGDARVRPVDEFELITAAPCPQDNEQPFRWGIQDTCIVALINKDGKPRPSQWPHVHADVASATKEAERLARNNPGAEFAVYQRVAGRVAEQHIEMKEVA